MIFYKNIAGTILYVSFGINEMNKKLEPLFYNKKAARACAVELFFQFKRFAVGAVCLGWIQFMGTYHNVIQRTVVFLTAVMAALLYSTLNRMVCSTFTFTHLK